MTVSVLEATERASVPETALPGLAWEHAEASRESDMAVAASRFISVLGSLQFLARRPEQDLVHVDILWLAHLEHDRSLLFRGTVEFGVSSALLGELAVSPLARSTSPFADVPRRRGVTWLEPSIAVEIQYNTTR